MNSHESNKAQISEMDELKQMLQQCQEELVESNEILLMKDNRVAQLEKELKTQATLLELDYQLKREEDILENKVTNKKFEKLTKENDDLKTKLGTFYEGLEKLTVEPSSEEDNSGLSLSYKATQVLLKQKCLDIQKSDEINSELTIRLEMEHERRVRAQTEIGEIEKERMLLQNELDYKISECVKKSHEYDKLSCMNSQF